MLCLAALTDLKTDHIPNGLTMLGVVTGLTGSLLYRSDLLQPAASMLFAFLLLYPLFKIGALGAGDIKVFIMIGSFVKMKDMIVVLVAAFVIGAVFSLVKLMIEHNGRERMCYFLSYLKDVMCARQWKIYGENMVQDYTVQIKYTLQCRFCLVRHCELEGLFETKNFCNL